MDPRFTAYTQRIENLVSKVKHNECFCNKWAPISVTLGGEIS